MEMPGKLWGRRKAEVSPEPFRTPDDIPAHVGDGERLAMLNAFEAEDICWFWAVDGQSRVTYMSGSAASRFGEGKQVLGRNLSELLDTCDDSGEHGGERPLNYFLRAKSKFSDQVVKLYCDEGEQWWSLTGRPHFDAERNFLGFRGSAHDITAQFARQRDEARAAQFDTLTGLFNRQSMERRLEGVLAKAGDGKGSCSVIMLSLDKFKKVNDVHGHRVGDAVLREVAQRIKRIVRSPGEIGRVGGDEFRIIMPRETDREVLTVMCDKVLKMIAQPISVGKERVSVSASAGVAIAPYDGSRCEELVANADLAMNAAKRDDAGQCRFYSNDLAESARKHHALGEHLRAALQADQLDMHYQPIVRAEDNTVVAFEALLRWDHPELGAIKPSTFLPLAEELNLGGKLGEWALRRACSDASEWPGGVRVSINVSAALFTSGQLVDKLREILDETCLRPKELELEINEEVFLGDPQVVDNVFRRLKKMGVHLSLDDFGTGFSSFAFLRRAPFERIKIDRSFVRGCCDEGSPNSAIISAFVSLADALGMETTAEGVEAFDELEQVKERGATQIQGYIFSEPVTQDMVLAKLGKGDFVYEPSGPERQRADRRTVFRRIKVHHGGNCYDAVLRNISASGAMIEGLLGVPVGTVFDLALGQGQMARVVVRRSEDAVQGVEFEVPLVEDGANGFVVPNRSLPRLPGDAKPVATAPVEEEEEDTREFARPGQRAGAAGPSQR